MGLFSKVGHFAKNIGKAIGSAVDSPISKAVASVIPGGEFIRGSISAIGSATGKIRSLGSDDSIRVSPQGYTSIIDSSRDTINGALTDLSAEAKDIRLQRAEAASRQQANLQDRFGSELVYSDDLLFAAVNTVALGRVPDFSFVKNAEESVPDVNSAGATGKVIANVSGSTITFGALLSATLGDIGAISTKMQSLVKDFILSKSLMAINPVITIISRLKALTATLDNPYDFYNFLGYNGPEVVRSIAQIDKPIINGMLKRVSEHVTSKAFAQWFAAVDHYKVTLESFRKITADWLGDEADGYPTFLIDMVTFYVFAAWGKEMMVNLYTTLRTREMDAVITPAELGAMHIYDIYDQIHYMQVASKATYDRVNLLTSSNPSEAERITYYTAGHNLIVTSFLLQLAQALIGLSGFGLDDEDINNIYSLCTGTDELLVDLAAICDQDNALYVQMSQRSVCESIIDAELMALSIQIASDNEVITTLSLEKLMSELSTTIGALDSLSVPEKAKMVNFYRNLSAEIRQAVAENRVSDQAYTLVQLTKIDAGIDEIEISLRG